MPPVPEGAPDLDVTQDAQGRSRIVLRGVWNLRALEPMLPTLQARLTQYGRSAGWDLSGVSAMDHAGALLLWRAWGRRMADEVELRADQAPLFEHLELPSSSKLPRRRRAWSGPVKRVALARALALEPELLFLDEPTAGLDPDRSESFVELLQGLHRELNLTVVMITHDLETLVALSDRVAVLADQKVVAAGDVLEVAAFDHPFVRNFFQGERGQRALAACGERVPAAPAVSGAAEHADG